MKKVIALSFSFLLGVGCIIPEQFTHLSSVETRARGVVFESPDEVQIGMFNNTCEVDPWSGFIGEDLDLVIGEEDIVLDSKRGTQLVTGDSRNSLVLSGEDWTSFPVRNVEQAKIIDSGYVVLSGGEDCALQRLSTSGELEWSTEVDCVEGFETSSEGQVFLPGRTEIRIGWDGDAPFGIGVAGDLISYSEWDQTLISAISGETIVRGSLGASWSQDLGSPIRWIDSSSFGSVVVMTGGDGAGAIWVMAAEDGSIISRFETPGVGELILSPDGSTVAVVVPDSVHFFRIE